MEQLSRQGHRQRMRTSYINGGTNGMADHNMLELLLSLVIPQKDVKELSYDLINHFGSLSNVMNASVEDLMEIKGVGECAAVTISLVRDINKRCAESEIADIINLSSSSDSCTYFKNLLSLEKEEKIIIVTLDNANNVINRHIVGSGGVSSASLDSRRLTQDVLRDNATSVIVGHNHPAGTTTPSSSDINFTLELRNLLNKVDIRLLDHIIVAKSTAVSLCSSPKWAGFFADNSNNLKVAASKKIYFDKK